MIEPNAEADLDAPSAVAIAAGMRRVAEADGHVHPNEVALIDAFATDLPEGVVPRERFDDEVIAAIYVQSLVLVALADGVVSDDERAVIEDLVAARGLDVARVEPAILEAKRWFLKAFSGVSVFRDAVVAIADELGLSADEVDRLDA